MGLQTRVSADSYQKTLACLTLQQRITAPGAQHRALLIKAPVDGRTTSREESPSRRAEEELVFADGSRVQGSGLLSCGGWRGLQASVQITTGWKAYVKSQAVGLGNEQACEVGCNLIGLVSL